MIVPNHFTKGCMLLSWTTPTTQSGGAMGLKPTPHTLSKSWRDWHYENQIHANFNNMMDYSTNLPPFHAVGNGTFASINPAALASFQNVSGICFPSKSMLVATLAGSLHPKATISTISGNKAKFKATCGSVKPCFSDNAFQSFTF